MCCHLAMTSANGLLFMYRVWTENCNPRFLHLLCNSQQETLKNPARRHLKNSSSKVKLLNAVCPKTSPKSAEKRIRAH